MKLTNLTPIAALAVSACASTVEVADTGEAIPATAIAAYDEPDGWPAEFSGRTVEITTRSGIVNVVNLAPDGTMTIVPELSTDVVKGTWGTKADKETVQELYPALWDRFVRGSLKRLAKSDATYDDKVRASRALGVPLDPSLAPDRYRALQEAAAASMMQAPQTQAAPDVAQLYQPQ